MKKNVASQVIGCQMVNATTGAAFTGAVTVYVTGDAGTQAVGSVGSGACAHEGNGFHTYAPAQAETNFDHIAFTFIGTGAIPATVQVYPTFPQTGDNFARLGAPAGASHAADVAAVKAQTAAIETDTQDVQARLPAALVSGRIDSSTGAMAANVMTAAAAAADLTNELQNGLATAAAVAALQTTADDIPTNAELAARTLAAADYATAANLVTVDTVADAIKAKTDNLPSDPADQSVIIAATDAVLSAISALASAGAIADAVLDEAVDGATTLRESLRLYNAALGGKVSGMAAGTPAFRDLADSKDRIVAVTDADGNRTAVVLDLS
jgi:hypothetical protein